MTSRSSLLVAASVAASVVLGCAALTGTDSGTPGLTIVSGDGQTGSAARALAAPLVVQLRDGQGRIVVGAEMSWQVTSGNGSVPFATQTDERGLASVIWTLGVEGVHQTVRASLAFGPDSASSSVAPVMFSATANGAATNLASVAGDGQVATVDDTLPVALRVRAVTATGQAVAGVRVAWTVGEGSVFPESTLTDASGEATTSWVLGATIGPQTARATAFLNGSPLTFTATANGARNAFTWTTEPLPTIPACGAQWTDLWAASATDVFVVGGCGSIRHFTGSSWDLQTAGTTYFLGRVWGRSPNDVFAVGVSGTVLHYDGTTWTAVAGVPSENVGAIWGTASELFLLTGLGLFTSRIWHYDGAVWTQQYQRGCPLSAIWGNSASDVFAVGPGPPLHYDGATWHDPGCRIGDTRTDVSGNGPGGVYATGWFECQNTRIPCTSADFVDQFADTGWIRRFSRPGFLSFRELWVGPSGDVVVVGVNGLILHSDGSHWRQEPSGTNATIFAISGSDPTSLWALTTDGFVLHGTRASAAPARVIRGKD